MNEWRNLIIPLLVLSFWGLRQIFERESPPANRLPPPGPRPGGPRPPEGIANREPSLRWSGPPPRPTPEPRRAGGRASARDEEVIIIRPEAILPDSPPSRQGQARRPPRTRSAGVSRAPEPPLDRTLGGAISQSVGQVLDRQIGLGPVDQRGSLSKSSTRAALPTDAEPPATALARALKSPGKLREAFILNELLQPPLALRGPRRR